MSGGGGKLSPGAGSDEATKMAAWLWSVALRLRLHVNSRSPASVSSHESAHGGDSAVTDSVTRYLRGDRQLALAAFLALVTSRCGHRFLVILY